MSNFQVSYPYLHRYYSVSCISGLRKENMRRIVQFHRLSVWLTSKLLMKWQALQDLPVYMTSEISHVKFRNTRRCPVTERLPNVRLGVFKDSSQYHISELLILFSQHTRRTRWRIHGHSLAQIPLCCHRARAWYVMRTPYPMQSTTPAHAFFYIVDVVPIMHKDRVGTP